MPESAIPVRRGPGRPTSKPTPQVKPDPDDPRIGQSCDSGWSSVGYGDGATYRCENGVIVERVR